ncbi:MAG: hypothetical protein KME03_06060 [Aphanocapsa lilacina HA4352-LM1]|nr:hypothetical protein [Aphanocapsa lilacina HA4352-LM1]
MIDEYREVGLPLQAAIRLADLLRKDNGLDFPEAQTPLDFPVLWTQLVKGKA